MGPDRPAHPAVAGRAFLAGRSFTNLNLEHGGGPDIRNLVLPEDMVLALGDHRGRSFDGRYFGLVHKRELYGRAVAVYYSRDEGFQWSRL